MWSRREHPSRREARRYAKETGASILDDGWTTQQRVEGDTSSSSVTVDGRTLNLPTGFRAFLPDVELVVTDGQAQVPGWDRRVVVVVDPTGQRFPVTVDQAAFTTYGYARPTYCGIQDVQIQVTVPEGFTWSSLAVRFRDASGTTDVPVTSGQRVIWSQSQTTAPPAVPGLWTQPYAISGAWEVESIVADGVVYPFGTYTSGDAANISGGEVALRVNPNGSTGPIPYVNITAHRWLSGAAGEGKYTYAFVTNHPDTDSISLRPVGNPYNLQQFRYADGYRHVYLLEATPLSGGEIGNFVIFDLPLSFRDVVQIPQINFGYNVEIDSLEYYNIQSFSYQALDWWDLIEIEDHCGIYAWGRQSSLSDYPNIVARLPHERGYLYPAGGSPLAWTCGGSQCGPAGAPELSICTNNCPGSSSAPYSRSAIHQWDNDSTGDLSRMCGYSLAWDITNTYTNYSPTMTVRMWGTATKVVGDLNWTVQQNIAFTGVVKTGLISGDWINDNQAIVTTQDLVPSGKVKFKVGFTARRYNCLSCGWYATGFQLDTVAPGGYGACDIFA